MTSAGRDTHDVHAIADHLFRREAGRMVARLVRVLGVEHLQLAEDAVQDALMQALRRWPFHGVPDNPQAWLRTVAKNRALDRLRRQRNWLDKAEVLRRTSIGATEGEATGTRFAHEVRDDQLRLMFACCHPVLGRDAQVGLTLVTVGGFSAAEIARAFLAPTPTVAQRLVRAKRKLRRDRVALEIPGPAALPARLEAVHEALYLMFNEGYAAHQGDELVRHDLCIEAIRLGRLLGDNALTTSPAGHALVALMCFQAARFATRVDAAGELLLLAEQDRSQWDQRLVQLGLRALGRAATGDRLTTYHLEAEIAACHSLAPSADATDWARILRSYDDLLAHHPSPVAALNRVVALAEVEGPATALAALSAVTDAHPTLDDYYPAHATRATLLRRLDRHAEALAAYDRALPLVASAPVRRYLERQRKTVAATIKG